MNKIGHIHVTRRLSVELRGVERFCFLAGSILPDIFVHTYIVGHKWDTTFEKTCERLNHLEAWGGTDCLSFLRLGYVLHYIEDYFTYPHNTIFEEDMKEHIKYENMFYAFLQEKEDTAAPAGDEVLSAAELCDWLCRLHDQYMAEAEHNFAVDHDYMTRAAQKTAESMTALFVRNEKLPETEFGIARKI